MKRTVSSPRPLGANSCSMSEVKRHSYFEARAAASWASLLRTSVTSIHLRQAGKAHARERAAHGAIHGVEMRLHLAMSFDGAFVAAGLDAVGHGDRPFDQIGRAHVRTTVTNWQLV